MTTALMPLPHSIARLHTEGFDAFLQAVHSTPLLDVLQEKELALRARQGDTHAARELALSNLRYVVWLARRYAGYGLPLADLVQEGAAGLLKAIRRFDPACGVRLISYATQWIRSEMHEYILRNWQIVRRATTKSQRKLFFKRQRLAALEAPGEKNREESVAQELEVSVQDLRDMRERLASTDVSLTPDEEPGHNWEPVDHRDPLCLLEEAEFEKHEAPRLRDAVAGLDVRSRDILVSRSLNEPPVALGELAERYGISAERVRQIQNQAMARIRVALDLEEKPRARTRAKSNRLEARV